MHFHVLLLPAKSIMRASSVTAGALFDFNAPGSAPEMIDFRIGPIRLGDTVVYMCVCVSGPSCSIKCP